MFRLSCQPVLNSAISIGQVNLVNKVSKVESHILAIGHLWSAWAITIMVGLSLARFSELDIDDSFCLVKKQGLVFRSLKVIKRVSFYDSIAHTFRLFCQYTVWRSIFIVKPRGSIVVLNDWDQINKGIQRNSVTIFLPFAWILDNN